MLEFHPKVPVQLASRRIYGRSVFSISPGEDQLKPVALESEKWESQREKDRILLPDGWDRITREQVRVSVFD